MVTPVIMGPRHRGKSTLALYLAYEFGKAQGFGPWVAIFDPNRQYKMKGPKVRLSRSQDDWLENLDDKDTSIKIYSPTMGDDVEEAFEFFATSLWGRKCFTMIVDEARMLQSAQWIHPSLDVWLRQGHGASVQVIQTSHIPTDFAGAVRSLTTHYYVFQLVTEKDLKHLSDIFSDDAMECARLVRGREFVCYEKDTGIFYVEDDSRKWYIPDIGPKLQESQAGKEGMS